MAVWVLEGGNRRQEALDTMQGLGSNLETERRA